MSDFDLIIRGAKAVLPDGEQAMDVGLCDGRITALAPAVFGSTEADLDATGFHVLAGLVDTWVSVGEAARAPRNVWALAAGGVTCYLDAPGVADRAAFESRRKLGEATSLVDFGLWGAMTQDNLEQLEDLVECGVIGFNAWMSGAASDRPTISDGALLEGMLRARDLKQIVAIHAENQEITAYLTQRAIATGGVGVRDYLDSRPVIAELEAIQRAILFAWETDCAVHFPQVSTGKAIEMIAVAKAQGLNVSCSTSPHYLTLTEEDAERLGALAKCAPPLRGSDDVHSLWKSIAAGEVDFLASAHTMDAPSGADDFFAAPCGIAGGQSTLPLMLAEAQAKEHPAPLTRLMDLLAVHPARRFRIHPQKGELAVGADADMVIIDMDEQEPVRRETLFYDPPERTPYLGQRAKGRVLRTLLRGKTVFREGQIVGKPQGRFVEAAGER